MAPNVGTFLLLFFYFFTVTCKLVNPFLWLLSQTYICTRLVQVCECWCVCVCVFLCVCGVVIFVFCGNSETHLKMNIKRTRREKKTATLSMVRSMTKS